MAANPLSESDISIDERVEVKESSRPLAHALASNFVSCSRMELRLSRSSLNREKSKLAILSELPP